jgi:hypothetical protein
MAGEYFQEGKKSPVTYFLCIRKISYMMKIWDQLKSPLITS